MAHIPGQMFEGPMFLSGGTQHSPALSGNVQHSGAEGSDTQALGFNGCVETLAVAFGTAQGRSFKQRPYSSDEFNGRKPESYWLRYAEAALPPLSQAVGKLPAARVWVSLNEALLL